MVTGNFTTVVEFILLGLTSRQDLQILLFIVFLTCYVISLIGNIVIIWISSTNPRLHTPMYFFLRNLSFLDIWYTSSVVPKMLINFLSVKKSISHNGCVTQMFIHMTLGGTECYLLLSMAYDRYVAICSPLHYTNIMHPALCIKMAAASWVGGVINSVINLVYTLQLPFCGVNVVDHFFCEVPALLELACADTSLNKTVLFFCAIMITGIPFSVIFFTYIKIISSIMKIRTSSGKRKAFSTCVSHVIVVALFYGTTLFIYLRPGKIHVLSQDKMATLFYSIITPMLNPLIYTLRNKDVKLALKETTGKKIVLWHK
ncbi:putative olfactory receptor 2B8 [Bufo gargarizans]|uniref:putative olfactory receptor 2B8 n=1 Tax=Bufo gargarizans TaxID=30331 RepID=UPI001CF1A4A0|nr:putative olfactory receptor 2B8 [Bufo gargarizans]